MRAFRPKSFRQMAATRDALMMLRHARIEVVRDAFHRRLRPPNFSVA